MLRHPTAARLEALGFHGMAGAFDEQIVDPAVAGLGFEDRFALLVDRESAWRDTKRLQARLRHARLRVQAAIEDIDFRAPRGLDRALEIGGHSWSSVRSILGNGLDRAARQTPSTHVNPDHGNVRGPGYYH